MGSCPVTPLAHGVTGAPVRGGRLPPLCLASSAPYAHAHAHAYAHAHAHATCHMPHARGSSGAMPTARCMRAYIYIPYVQVDTLVDSLPLCMLIMGQKNSDVVTMYS